MILETKMSVKQKKSQFGYSLIEIPIGLFIIGLMLLIYAAASNTVILNKNAKNQELAHRIAAGKMEDLRATAFASLPSSGSFTHSLLSNLPSGQANLTVSDYNADTKQITVTVTWKESGNSNTRTVSFTTLMTKNGI